MQPQATTYTPRQALHDVQAALAAQREGHADDAEQLCTQVLAHFPRQALALSLRGILAQQRGQPQQAIALLRLAEQASGGAAVQRLCLANALMDDGQWAEAHALHAQLAAQDPQQAQAWFGLGVTAAGLGQHADAIDHFTRALALAPQLRAAMFHLAMAHTALGELLFAARWLLKLLALEPGHLKANQQLSSLYEASGELVLAARYRDRAFQQKAVFVEPATAPGAAATARTVLVLCSAETANTPFEHLLPRATTSRIVWMVAYATAQQARELPPYDLVFNVIADPPALLPAAANMTAFLRGCGKPVLNPPLAVARSARDNAQALLGDIPGLAVPTTVALRTEDLRTVVPQLPQLQLPLLLRPSGSHGGNYLTKITSQDALHGFIPFGAAAYYATNYHEFQSADGFYRKYRVIFIDRQPFPYHLAISPKWMVHYYTAEMPAHAWKLDEERRFLADPAAALGQAAWATLTALGQRLDLDYAGVDCSLLPDGRVLLFEANANMLVHLEEPNGPLAHKNPFVQRIYDAFNALMDRVSTRTRMSA